jgi:hypothetical protein
MPLHPQAKAFLDGIAALNPPDISEAGAFVARSNSHGEPDISGPIDLCALITDSLLQAPPILI